MKIFKIIVISGIAVVAILGLAFALLHFMFPATPEDDNTGSAGTVSISEVQVIDIA